MPKTRSIVSFGAFGLLIACASTEGPSGGAGPEGTAGGNEPDGAAPGDATLAADGSTAQADGGRPPSGSSSGGDGSADAAGAVHPAEGGAARDGAVADSATGGTTRDGAIGDSAGGATRDGAITDSGGSTGPRGPDAGTSGGGTDACASGPIGAFSGALATGITFVDTDGQPVNAHGGGIIQVGGTFYMHGEFFLSTTTNNDFNGFSMYSSKDLATWKNEGIILPQQPSGDLGPVRKGERPHIIQCPSTGEFVLYAHAASEDYQTDKEVVYATSATVNGQYAYKGPLMNAAGQIAAHSDMSAYADGTGAFVLTESGDVYTLASDCHSWVSDQVFSAVNGDSGGSESPTVFKAGSTYYWIGSYKTGWRANNNFYSTAPAVTGPWTFQGFVAPVTDPTNDISDQRTWLTQSTWVQPIAGCSGTVYVYWGDHWYGNQDTTAPGLHNNLATYVFQPLVFTGTKISMPTYFPTWSLNVGAGTWSQP